MKGSPYFEPKISSHKKWPAADPVWSVRSGHYELFYSQIFKAHPAFYSSTSIHRPIQVSVCLNGFAFKPMERTSETALNMLLKFRAVSPFYFV